VLKTSKETNFLEYTSEEKMEGDETRQVKEAGLEAGHMRLANFNLALNEMGSYTEGYSQQGS
jgi:hypothetical protein